MTDIEAIAKDIVDCAIKVHKALGPGLLESATSVLMLMSSANAVGMPKLRSNFQSLLPIHEAQLLTYMKLSGCKIGFLLNWNVTLVKNGIKRFVLNLPEDNIYRKRTSSFLKP